MQKIRSHEWDVGIQGCRINGGRINEGRLYICNYSWVIAPKYKHLFQFYNKGFNNFYF